MRLNAQGMLAAEEALANAGTLRDAIAAYLNAELRAVGYTTEATDHPKSELGVIMMAAWCNVQPDQLPFGARFSPNASSVAAWGRVGAAALEYYKATREHF